MNRYAITFSTPPSPRWPISREELLEGEITDKEVMTEGEWAEYLATHTAEHEAYSVWLDAQPTQQIDPVRVLSKLAIRRQLREWGKESAFDAMLAAFPHAKTDWDDALEIKTSDPLFAANKEAFKAALALSDEQFSTLMSLS